MSPKNHILNLLYHAFQTVQVLRGKVELERCHGEKTENFEDDGHGDVDYVKVFGEDE